MLEKLQKKLENNICITHKCISDINHKFIVIAFYTIDTGYVEEVKRLLKSVIKIGVPYEICGIKSLGSWQRNCQYKANFIKMMLLKHQQPILYIDADAMFNKYPVLLNNIKADFAVHYFKGKELAAGTLYFNNTKIALYLIDDWINENKKYPNLWDQKTLQKAFERMRSKINFQMLPAEYAKIFDTMDYIKEPVITGFQASRHLKGTINEDTCNRSSS